MRKFTTVFSLWLSSLTLLTAQSAFPLEGAIWEESTFTVAGQFIRYRLLCGDTTINDATFAKIYDIAFPFDGEGLPTDTIPPAIYAGGLRVAANGNEVYYVQPGQTDELLLYDFSLEAESSIDLPNTTLGNEGTYNVTNVDSVMINGAPRKRLFLENVFGQTNDVWIEGIGSVTYGLLDRGLGLVFDYGSSLHCVQFTDEGFIFRPDVNGDCRMAVTGCDILSPAFERADYSAQIGIYPNPNSGRFTVRLPSDGAKWQLQLWSMDGKMLREQNYTTPNFDWSQLPKGIYLLKIARDGQYVYGEKLVVGF